MVVVIQESHPDETTFFHLSHPEKPTKNYGSCESMMEPVVYPFGGIYDIWVPMRLHPWKKHDIAKFPFSIGNTSSNGGSCIVMLVFRRGKFPQYFVGAKDGCQGPQNMFWVFLFLPMQGTHEKVTVRRCWMVQNIRANPWICIVYLTFYYWG